MRWGCIFLLCWQGRGVGVEGRVAYPYFICEVRDRRAKEVNGGLEMLYLGAAWFFV